MKSMVSMISIVMLAVSSFAGESNIAPFSNIKVIVEPTVTEVIEVPYYSTFNNRGRTFSNEGVLQPNVTVTKSSKYGSLFISAWGNMLHSSNTDKIEEGVFNETDLIIGYFNTYKNLTYEIGDIAYIYSHQEIENTQEIYVKFTYSTFLTPTVSVYYDEKQVKGFYGSFGVSHPVKLTDKCTITADTLIGYANPSYNDFYFGVDKDTFNDWNSGLTLALNVMDNCVVSTGIRYINLIDKDIENGAKDLYGKGDDVVTKVAVTLSF